MFYIGFIVVFIFVLLSFWQYNRYIDQTVNNNYRDIQEEYLQIEIINFNQYEINDMVKIQNDLRLIKSYLLRSRVHNGESGYHLIEIRKHNAIYVLINRGWVPIEHNNIMSIEFKPTDYKGTLKEYDIKPKLGQEDVPESNYLFRLDRDFIESELDIQLLDLYIQLTEDCGVEVFCIEDLDIYEPPHLSYSFQWLFFAICLSIVILRKNKLI